jgi:poly-beta-1,6-N-acetyl-D-glucosamine biosynthesis protein PgaD
MKWPPIIEDARVPWWGRVRDVALTLLAWLLMVYLLRGMSVALFYAVLDAMGIAHPLPPWPKGKLIRDIASFLWAVMVLVVWLTAFSLVRLRLLTNTRAASSQPEPLAPADLDRAFDLSTSAREVMERLSIITVHLSGQGESVEVEAGRTEGD